MFRPRLFLSYSVPPSVRAETSQFNYYGINNFYWRRLKSSKMTITCYRYLCTINSIDKRELSQGAAPINTGRQYFSKTVQVQISKAMLSKVNAAVFVLTVILYQAAAANLPEPQDLPNPQDVVDAVDTVDTVDAVDAPNSLEVRASDIDERASNFLNVKNWNEKAIDNRYNGEDATALAYALNNIYTGTVASFKKMVKLQLYLFQKFDDAGDVNDKYTFNVAYYFLNIKKNQYYASLSNNLKRKLNDYISYLPPSLDFLFFKPNFCLLNRKYLNYIYATDTTIDGQRNYIFVFKNNNNNLYQRAWTTKFTDVSSNRQTKLKFTLKHNQSKRFAYLERNSYNGKSNMVAAWRSSFQQPSNSDWNVALHQNQLIFSQNGRHICADDSLYDRNRRYVLGLGGNGKDAPECQWYAKECP